MEERKLSSERAARYIWTMPFSAPSGWGLEHGCVKIIGNGTSFHIAAAGVRIRYAGETGLSNAIRSPDERQKSQTVCENLSLGNLVPATDDFVRYGRIPEKSGNTRTGHLRERTAV